MIPKNTCKMKSKIWYQIVFFLAERPPRNKVLMCSRYGYETLAL